MLIDLEINKIRCSRMVEIWNKMFCLHNTFPHTNPNIANGVKQKPDIFEYFPNMEADCKEFIYNNFDSFSVEMLWEELICHLISKHMNALKQSIDAGIARADCDQYKLLDRYLSNPSSYSTVLNWMHAMGFKRDSAKKSYYVYGQEKPEQQKHRAQFIKQYLTKIEPRCHRWVQLTLAELQSIKSTLDSHHSILNGGYYFQQSIW